MDKLTAATAKAAAALEECSCEDINLPSGNTTINNYYEGCGDGEDTEDPFEPGDGSTPPGGGTDPGNTGGGGGNPNVNTNDDKDDNSDSDSSSGSNSSSTSSSSSNSSSSSTSSSSSNATATAGGEPCNVKVNVNVKMPEPANNDALVTELLNKLGDLIQKIEPAKVEIVNHVPEVKLPEQPDYTAKFDNLITMIQNLPKQIDVKCEGNDCPKVPDYTDKLAELELLIKNISKPNPVPPPSNSESKTEEKTDTKEEYVDTERRKKSVNTRRFMEKEVCERCGLPKDECECPAIMEEKISRRYVNRYARFDEYSPAHEHLEYDDNYDEEDCD